MHYGTAVFEILIMLKIYYNRRNKDNCRVIEFRSRCARKKCKLAVLPSVVVLARSVYKNKG
jgi:hypothetical protein